METNKTVRGLGPHGGVRTDYYYFDKDGLPCEESNACSIQIIEKDKDGNDIFTLIAGDVKYPDFKRYM